MIRRALILGLPFFVSCTMTPPYVFEPKPQEVRVLASPAGDTETARVLMSFLELRRSPIDEGYELLGRLRVENFGSVPLTIKTQRMVLVSADLQEFGAPRLYTGSDPVLPPGGDETLDLAFPLPAHTSPAEMDFSTINLRCPIETLGETMISLNFHGELPRVEPPLYDHFGVGFGYGCFCPCP